MRRSLFLALLALVSLFVVPRVGVAGSLTPDGRAGVVTALQGTAVVRPIGRERWTPLDARSVLFPGDVLRTEARGANALEIRLATGARLVVGPGAVLEFPDAGGIRLLRGDVEVKAEEKAPLSVAGSGGYSKSTAGTAWLRATDSETKELKAEPKWLTGYRSSTSEEWMGSLLATVDGKNVPLTVGYHKVTVEIRDQIARTTVEESFVNSTKSVLEGVFSFPLPADASISGFGMWIGDELVEADLVEKQRARAIYEDILRRKKDPGLLEWEGGNLFKARVYPIWGESEKRIRIRYTQVLPLEGDAYRYRYALRSELLRAHPLRELSMSLSVVSTAAIREVVSPTHPVTVRKTEHEAVVEFGAQEYSPDRDFEVAFTIGRGDPVTAIAHRRGDDGFFMLLLSLPDSQASPARELVPEGEPLDLVLVADTSGSMDSAARSAQSQFLAALLAQLSPKDHFRLMACDVEPHWLTENSTPAGESEVAAALALLDQRYSLGWTDLDKAFDAALAKAGAKTHIIYVGDGIPTAGKADPVATADRIRTKAKGTTAICHAVSTASSYEAVVLRAIASIGGGSVRRGEEAPAAAARALLSEIARPGWKDLKVEVRGLPTARVYPETLPNLPVGEQQVVLGRFLPGSDAKSADVVVTGTLAGKAVTYTSSLAVPPPEGGNSFLPRLWAKKHLDALLLQGQSAETKAEIVEFSREYQIMTPYTSFLVLENDEDRAKYGVERTVKMRDAERFFAAARDKAQLEIARKQMETAHRWRIGLRRRMRQEIELLGRNLPIPAAYGWLTEFADRNGDGVFSGPVSGFGSGGGAGGAFRRGITSAENLGLRDWGVHLYAGMDRGKRGEYEPDGATVDRLGESFDAAAARPSAAAAPAPMAPMSTTPADAESAEDGNEAAPGDEADDAPAEESREFSGKEKKQLAAKVAYGRSDYRRMAGEALSPSAGAYFSDGKDSDFRARAENIFGYSWGNRAPISTYELGFPYLEAPPSALPAVSDPAWDPLVLQALKALDRRPALAAMAGSLRIRSQDERVHPLRGTAESRSRASALVSARRWHVLWDGAFQLPAASWCSETERGAAHMGVGLGRKRTAADADRARCPIPLADHSLDDILRGYALSYRRAPKVAREGDIVRITFATDSDPGVEQRLSIDVARGVLVEEASFLDGQPTGATRFADFVKVAGMWWATKVENIDDEGHVVGRQTLAVEELDSAGFERAFASAMGANSGVVFLPAADPSLAAAKQALHDGRAAFADHLAIALGYAGRQKWDDAWKAFAAAVSPTDATIGASWMRLTLLGRSRRGVELEQHASAMAKTIAASQSPYAAWKASELDRLTDALGGSERLALFDSVRAAWDHAGPDHDLWSLAAQKRHADAQEQAGNRPAARAEREAIATARPFDAAAVIAHAADLVAGEDIPAAAAYVGERATKGGPWTSQEAQQLFSSWIAWLWDVRDLPGLEAAGNAWVAAQPKDAGARHVQLATMYFRGKYAEADRVVLERLNADVATLSDPAARAALDAAIRIAIGTGWNFWAQTIPVEWRAPLANLVLRFARSDLRHADFMNWIVGDWRFSQSEEARQLRADLLADVSAEGAVASMPLRRLSRCVGLVGWNSNFGWNSNDVSADARRRVLDALLSRWRKAPDAAEEASLAALVRSVLDGRGTEDEKLAFRRERLGKASGDVIGAAALELFDLLLTVHHDAAREDEIFALVPKLFDARDQADASRTRAASIARRIAPYVYAARLEAAMGKPEDQAKWTRAEARTKSAAARTEACTDTAAKFASAALAADANLRPWYEVERLGYAAETLADFAKSEGEAREILDAVPAGSDASIDRLLAERAAVVLSYSATRKTAPAGLADRVIALLRARLLAKDKLLDNRYHIFRLLVALDRADDLEKDLVSWIEPDEIDLTWRVALAYLQAETSRVKEAAATMESAAALDDLGAPEQAALANWYLVLKEDAKREAALDKKYEAIPEWQLQNMLWQEAGRISRNGEGVPAELDPEAMRALRILLGKSGNPEQAMQHVLGLYRPTKDFRVLQSMADGILGHSAEAVYAYALAANGVIADIHEEATCDALGARIDVLLKAAKTDVDRRALRLLLVAVENRAGAVPKADPQHGLRALDALNAAFEGGFVRGERVLVARQLAALGASHALAAQQMARLEELLAAATEGSMERLAIGRHLAQVLWDRQSKDAAADRLEALLAAVRADFGGTLLPEAREPYDTLINWWSEMGRSRRAEAKLKADIALEPRSGRRERLRMRLFQLYVGALQNHAELSIGANGELFRVAAAEMERYLSEGSAYLLAETAQHHGELHGVQKAGAEYEAFVRERLPAILARNPLETLGVMQAVLDHLHRLQGPLPPIAATLDLLDREPAWFRRIGQDFWQRFSGWLAEWRREAGSVGALEPRLLAYVLKHLEADLVAMSWESSSFCHRNSSSFWREHAADFAAVAARIAELHAAEPQTALFVAEYQRTGLDLRREAVSTLEMAVAHGKDTENLRWTLAQWLHEDGRDADALPILTRLISERVDTLPYRTLASAVLHALKRDADALKVLEDAAAHWKEKKDWNLNVAAALGIAALDAALPKPAAEWMDDALRLRREAGGGSGPDATLSAWLGTLAKARSLLGETDAAVRAASAAVVAWGSYQDQRQKALGDLFTVIDGALDFEAWLARYDAEASASGLDAPAIRKAIGRSFVRRGAHAKAAEQFRAARDLDPSDAETHGLLVKAFDAAGDTKGALDALFASVRLATKNLAAYPDLAERFSKAGDEASAERARTNQVEAMPSDPDGHRGLAKLREAASQWAQAAEQWGEVARVRPLEPEGFLGMANADIRAGDKAAARAAIDHLLETKWEERFGDIKAQAAKLLEKAK